MPAEDRRLRRQRRLLGTPLPTAQLEDLRSGNGNVGTFVHFAARCSQRHFLDQTIFTTEEIESLSCIAEAIAQAEKDGKDDWLAF